MHMRKKIARIERSQYNKYHNKIKEHEVENRMRFNSYPYKKRKQIDQQIR